MRSNESIPWMKRVEGVPCGSFTEKLGWTLSQRSFQFCSSSRFSSHSSGQLASWHPRMNISRSFGHRDFQWVLWSSVSLWGSSAVSLCITVHLHVWHCHSWVSHIWHATECHYHVYLCCDSFTSVFSIRQEPFLWIPSLAGPVASGRHETG